MAKYPSLEHGRASSGVVESHRRPRRRQTLLASKAAPGGFDARLEARMAGAQTHHLPLFTMGEARRAANKSYIHVLETLSFYETKNDHLWFKRHRGALDPLSL